MSKRILIYSHDTFGLGNLRRNHALATALVRGIPGARVLLMTGSRWFHFLPSDPRIEFVKLPELSRTDRGAYASRAAGVALDPLIKVRREILVGTARGFHPDLCLVDKVPLGVGGELQSALDVLAACGTQVVLTVRDILDEPAWTRAHWRRSGQYDALESYYGSVWVLGEESVYPTGQHYELGRGGRVDVQYLGYIEHSAAHPGASVPASGRALVTVGGGEDGRALLDAATAALERLDTARFGADVVLGPLLDGRDREDVRARLRRLPNVRALDYTLDIPRRIRAARSVIAMGGYNTVCEILATETPALVAPRTEPSREQSLRATCMGRLGFFATEATTPGSRPSADRLRAFIESPGARVRTRPSLRGLDRAVALAAA